MNRFQRFDLFLDHRSFLAQQFPDFSARLVGTSIEALQPFDFLQGKSGILASANKRDLGKRVGFILAVAIASPRRGGKHPFAFVKADRLGIQSRSLGNFSDSHLRVVFNQLDLIPYFKV